MASTAYRRWITTSATALDEIEQAHAFIGGTGPGRRYATQQMNHAYAVLLAAQFQGFCRDLHNECGTHLASVALPGLAQILRSEFAFHRTLDRGNPNPGNLGSDFGRLGIELWPSAQTADPRVTKWRIRLEELNAWRNAISHNDFDPVKLGGTITLRLERVRRWRRACRQLARIFDEVMHRHLIVVTGKSPW